MVTVDRMHWFFSDPDELGFFTNHNKLIVTFDPLAVYPDLSQNTVNRVLRWAVWLCLYTFTWIHIKENDNVWDNSPSWWSKPLRVRRLVEVHRLHSSSSEEFRWPTMSSILEDQNKFFSFRTLNVQFKEYVYRYASGTTWVPSQAEELQLRLRTNAHTCASGKQAIQPTLSALSSQFYWETMLADIKTFIHAFRHCISTSRREKIPLLFGPSIHSTCANGLLQLDIHDVRPEKVGANRYWFQEMFAQHIRGSLRLKEPRDYMLLKLWSTGEPHLESLPKGLLSDGPTHFENATIEAFAKRLKVPHHFTLPSCPWCNGGIERLGKEIVRIFRTTLSKLLLSQRNWPDLLSMAESVINNSPSHQCGIFCPITAFTGHEQTPPIEVLIPSATMKAINDG